jgi:hypothetical protein
MTHFIIDRNIGKADGMMLSHIELQLSVQSQLPWQSKSLEQPKSLRQALYSAAQTPCTTAWAQSLHTSEGGPPPTPLLAELVTAPVLGPAPAPDGPVVTPALGPEAAPDVGPTPAVVTEPAPAPEGPTPAVVPWAALVTRPLAALADAVPPAPVAPPAPGSTVTFEPQAPVAIPMAPTATKLHKTHFIVWSV